MSQLAELTGGGASSLVPGFTLSRLDWKAKGIVEDCLQKFHIERTVRSTTEMSASQRQETVAKSASDALWFCTMGSNWFELRALKSVDGKFTSILASIRMTQPDATQDAVQKAIAPMSKVQIEQAVDWVWGHEPAAT